jgi:MFS family permease
VPFLPRAMNDDEGDSFFDRVSARGRAQPLGPQAAVLRRDLALIHSDSIAASVMVGTGETYLAAFALALGLGDIFAGSVATVPLMAGAVIQLVAPWGVRRVRSHRRWVSLCVALQAASFVPLVIAGVVGSISGAALLAIATCYWATGMMAGSAWNTWVGTIVPKGLRSRFFARRTRLGQVGLLGGLLVGGAILHAGETSSHHLLAFAALFAVASVARAGSVWLLRQQSEPEPELAWSAHEAESDIRTALRGNKRLLGYLLALQVCVQVSGPYFTPFWLSDSALHLSYVAYMTLIATAFVSKIAALPWLGHLAARHGARRMLRWAGVLVVPMPALWTLSTHYGWFVAIQLLSGVFWGAHELATFLLFFDAIRPEDRTRVLTGYNLLNATAMITGTAFGAFVLRHHGIDVAGYVLLFWISAGARLLTLPLLAWIPEADTQRALAERAESPVQRLPEASDSPLAS